MSQREIRIFRFKAEVGQISYLGENNTSLRLIWEEKHKVAQGFEWFWGAQVFL